MLPKTALILNQVITMTAQVLGSAEQLLSGVLADDTVHAAHSF